MTEKELFDNNNELASEFSRFVIANPGISKKLPPDSELVFLVDSNPELTKANMGLAKKIPERRRQSCVHPREINPAKRILQISRT